MFSPYLGEAEAAIRQAFLISRNAAPALLFFDEIDAIVSKRGGDDKVRSGYSFQAEEVKADKLNLLSAVGTRDGWRYAIGRRRSVLAVRLLSSSPPVRLQRELGARNVYYRRLLFFIFFIFYRFMLCNRLYILLMLKHFANPPRALYHPIPEK